MDLPGNEDRLPPPILRRFSPPRPPPLETKTRPPIFQMAPFLEHVSRAGIEDFEYSKKRDSKGEGDFYLVHPREEENEFLVSVEFTG